MTASPIPTTRNATPRFAELESLRGLAACAVVIHHCLLTLPAIYPAFYSGPDQVTAPWAKVVTYTPLHLLWGGYEAVVLFFVLSGFVLTLGIWEGRALKMEPFVIRRIWRIWVPFVPIVALAYLASTLLGTVAQPGVSEWFNRIWQGASPEAFLEHLLMLNRMDSVGAAFIPVVWTLKYEMWLSLLLPLVLLLARQRWWLALGLAAASVVLGHSGMLSGNVADTFHRILQFLPMFVLGAVLARHHRAVIDWMQGRSNVLRWGLLVLAGWLGCLAWVLPSVGERSTRGDLAITAGAALLVALALGWPWLRNLLLLLPLRWLGQVSFSVYLWHTLVLVVLIRLQVLPLWLSLLLTLPLTLLIAWPYHRFVELPAMAWGRRLTTPRPQPEPRASASAPLTQPR